MQGFNRLLRDLFKVRQHSGRAYPRKRALMFGNSIAGQGLPTIASGAATVLAETRPNSATLVLATGGVAAAGLVNGDYFVTTVASSNVMLGQAVSITGETLTLAKRTPKLIRAGALVTKVTSPTFWPGSLRRGLSLFTALNEMSGAPYDILQGYGFGGGFAIECLADLPDLLEKTSPHIVCMNLLENDVPSPTYTTNDLKSFVDTAVAMCVNAGAIPVIATCLPTVYITTPARAAVYDEINAYIMNIASKFPAAVPVDFSSFYVDTSVAAMPRQPIAGWTDGVHPNANRKYRIAANALDSVKHIFTPISSLANILQGPNVKLNGTGGTAVGLVGGSSVATNTTITADAGVTGLTSKSSSDGQYFDVSIPGASNISSTLFRIEQTYTFPRTWGASTIVKGIARIRIDDIANFSMHTFTLENGSAQACDVRDQDQYDDPTAIIGRTLTIETPAMPVGETGATTSKLTILLRPKTIGSPSGAKFKGELIELGWTVVPIGDYAY